MNRGSKKTGRDSTYKLGGAVNHGGGVPVPDGAGVILALKLRGIVPVPVPSVAGSLEELNDGGVPVILLNVVGMVMFAGAENVPVPVLLAGVVPFPENDGAMVTGGKPVLNGTLGDTVMLKDADGVILPEPGALVLGETEGETSVLRGGPVLDDTIGVVELANGIEVVLSTGAVLVFTGGATPELNGGGPTDLETFRDGKSGLDTVFSDTSVTGGDTPVLRTGGGAVMVSVTGLAGTELLF